MVKKKVYCLVSGILVVLVGIAVGLGGFQLWRGMVSSSPNLVADASTINNAAFGMLVLAASLIVAGSAAALNRR